MPNYQVTAETPVPSSFAVDQVRGMFDLEAEKVARVSFDVELPADDELIDGEPWRIGVIVGPSGSGKTTVARHAYGRRFSEGGYRWEKSKAVCDHFAGVSMKTVSQAFNAVGFSSPPSWIKPHHVLSGGERFRCDLVRALLKSQGDLIAFDEFTSVVDRTVAKIGSAAVAKSIRKNRFGDSKQFVAVTCHYDVLDWLEPDWVLDMASCQLARGRLRQRPPINLQVAPVHRSAWNLFRRHHYLNTNIQRAAKCFVAFWGEEPVAFSAWLAHRVGRRNANDMREHRTVVLPDFQGVGIGNRVSEFCASIWRGIDPTAKAYSTTSHPGMIHYRNASPLWLATRFGMVAPPNKKGRYGRELRDGMIPRTGGYSSSGRITGGFQYAGPSMPSNVAAALAEEHPTRHVLRTLEQLGGTTAARVARVADYSLGCTTSTLNTLARSGHVDRFRRGRNGWAYEINGAGKELLAGDF